MESTAADAMPDDTDLTPQEPETEQAPAESTGDPSSETGDESAGCGPARGLSGAAAAGRGAARRVTTVRANQKTVADRPIRASSTKATARAALLPRTTLPPSLHAVRGIRCSEPQLVLGFQLPGGDSGTAKRRQDGGKK